jgi:hypothetical protein
MNGTSSLMIAWIIGMLDLDILLSKSPGLSRSFDLAAKESNDLRRISLCKVLATGRLNDGIATDAREAMAVIQCRITRPGPGTFALKKCIPKLSGATPELFH